MTNKEILKKQIIYRSTHRGSKEIDLLLGKFVQKYIENFNNNDLADLEKLLLIEDDVIYKWYFENKIDKSIPVSKVSKMLKDFKI